MTCQAGSSLHKSCARRSFSLTCGNSQAFATQPHSLGDPILGRDPWLEKLWLKGLKISRGIVGRIEEGRLKADR